MKRTNVIELKPSKVQKKLLKEMMLLSSSVYNMTNYVIRQQFINNEKISSFFDLQQKLQNKKDYKMLGRSYSLPRIQLYSETNSARFKLIKSKSQKRVGLPKYFKNRKTNTTIPSFLVIDNSQYSIKKNKVRIPLSRKMRKKYSIKNFNINYNGILKHSGKQLRGQIHFKDKKFYLYQSVEVVDVKKLSINNSVGVDLGVKRLLTFYTEQGKSLIIGSKRFFKQWQYYNILISKEQQFLSTLNRKISNKLKILYSKRKKYQKQLFDNVINNFFRKIKNNTQQIFIGDVKGIRKQKSNKIVNSMINNYWSYDIFYNKIKCKAEELGITLTKINESYTSMTCPECSHCHEDNKQDRNFICVSCGYQDDRDIVGARNILRKGMYGSLKNIHRDEVIPLVVSV